MSPKHTNMTGKKIRPGHVITELLKSSDVTKGSYNQTTCTEQQGRKSQKATERSVHLELYTQNENLSPEWRWGEDSPQMLKRWKKVSGADSVQEAYSHCQDMGWAVPDGTSLKWSQSIEK